MIRRDRSQVAEPAALGKPYAAGKNKGKTELQVVLAALAAHLAAARPPEEFAFDYERYKDAAVKIALDQLFEGKCAYCEAFYASTQPMDVEHWRPKAEIYVDGGQPLRPGYYWLASAWDNLLPSCIDCNRARLQLDVVVGGEVLLGKANQFPLPPGKAHARGHDPAPDLAEESPLLVNPCADAPEELFEYTEEGAIVPWAAEGPERERALASIRVYALNRSGLVAERREVIRLIDHRLELIRRLADLRDRVLAQGLGDLATIVEELIAIEVDALQAMKVSSSPFAGLTRYLLRDG